MSTSHPDRAAIDAGYKTFGADSLIAYRDTPGFSGMEDLALVPFKGVRISGSGVCLPRPVVFTIWIPRKKLSFGERLEIIPNNATLVINMLDWIYGVRNGVVEKVIPVTGRGRGN